MKVTAYMYPKCGTCRNALKWLEENGVETEKINVVETPPSKEELRLFMQQSGLPARKLFNTSGEVYRSMNLKERLPHMDEEEMLDLLASNGKLIKRPIVTDGKRTTVGFKEDQYSEVWS